MSTLGSQASIDLFLIKLFRIPLIDIYVHYQQIGYFISRYRQNVNLISIKRGGGGKLNFKGTVSVNLTASLSKDDCPQRYPGNPNLI